MQIKKLFENLIIALSVITITACTSVDKNNNGQMIESGIDTNISTKVIGKDKSNISVERQKNSLHMLQLQKNNIVYFDLDKYNISPKFIRMLDAHASFLLNNLHHKITIEGHADERGTPEYNISLGEHRANAIKTYLQSKGVSTEQISIVSYGKEKPAVIGHNENAYSKNRRAVLVY